jgi:23S rRNA pseudouridine1911/1915/1917 synthase
MAIRIRGAASINAGNNPLFVVDGFPIVGDPQYGPKRESSETGQYLHAIALSFLHPITKAPLRFETPYPASMLDYIKNIQTS